MIELSITESEVHSSADRKILGHRLRVHLHGQIDTRLDDEVPDRRNTRGSPHSQVAAILSDRPCRFPVHPSCERLDAALVGGISDEVDYLCDASLRLAQMTIDDVALHFVAASQQCDRVADVRGFRVLPVQVPRVAAHRQRESPRQFLPQPIGPGIESPDDLDFFLERLAARDVRTAAGYRRGPAVIATATWEFGTRGG